MVALFAAFNRKVLLFVPNMLLWIQRKDYLVDDNELEDTEEGMRIVIILIILVSFFLIESLPFFYSVHLSIWWSYVANVVVSLNWSDEIEEEDF